MPERPGYLTKAYQKEKLPEPRNFIGIAKELLGPEMEKPMPTHIEVGDSDLRQLEAEAPRSRGTVSASKPG